MSIVPDPSLLPTFDVSSELFRVIIVHEIHVDTVLADRLKHSTILKGGVSLFIVDFAKHYKDKTYKIPS